MAKNKTYRFNPIDVEQIRLSARLIPGQRIQRMLDARELAAGLIRGRQPSAPLQQARYRNTQVCPDYASNCQEIHRTA